MKSEPTQTEASCSNLNENNKACPAQLLRLLDDIILVERRRVCAPQLAL
jgi:hypothetical protein